MVRGESVLYNHVKLEQYAAKNSGGYHVTDCADNYVAKTRHLALQFRTKIEL